MPRMTFVLLPLLAVLVLLVPGRVVAVPPEGVSGVMVFDEVADGLRKYRNEKDPERRIRWLERLAPTHDPRVAVALGEATTERTGDFRFEASILLLSYSYIPLADPTGDNNKLTRVKVWWRANEADLRRRVRELPQ